MQKQYALEQLNITAMQIEAMKATAKVFRSFTKTHSIDKLEQLQGNMEDLQDQIMEINETIGASPLLFDEDELKIIEDAIDNTHYGFGYNDQWEQAGVGYLTEKPKARSTEIKWIESEILNKKLGQSFEDANKIYKFQITELSDIGILKYLESD